MKKFEVWIYDEESGFNQAIICKATDEEEAVRIGLDYIHDWDLVGAEITRVKHVLEDGPDELNLYF